VQAPAYAAGHKYEEKPMRVPFIDLKSLSALVKERALRAWEHAVDHTEFVSGPTVEALQARLAEELGVRHVVCCGSGTEALIIGLQALGVTRGSKVALPNLTFWATYEAVVQLGAEPVLIDVDPDHLQLSLTELRRASEQLGLDAVVLVHLMGWASPELTEIRRFCAEAALPLLEDGAQSFGVTVGDHPVYRGAQLSTLSFYPAKVLGGCMDGGAILTDDDALARLVRTLCNHGRSTHYTYTHVGWNSRMGGLQAAWLLELLPHQGAIVAQRRELEQAYLELFDEHRAFVRPHRAPATVRGNGYLSVCELVAHDPDKVAATLAAAGVAVGRTYPETIAEQPPAKAARRVSELAHSRAFCRRVLNLPLYYGMTAEQQSWASAAFVKALEEAS
jgi:UDP-2-acetamido-2-deoxy-ribo-hexuluronate aminotransferase